MSVVGLYWDYTYGFYSEGGGEGNWTLDWEISPSSVFALSNLSRYASEQDGGSAAFAYTGLLSYVTQDPQTGVPTEHDIAYLPVSQSFFGSGVVPSFFDSNVITITFGYGCSAENLVEADANFLAFVFG
jgi:hypothetical protein